MLFFVVIVYICCRCFLSRLIRTDLAEPVAQIVIFISRDFPFGRNHLRQMRPRIIAVLNSFSVIRLRIVAVRTDIFCDVGHVIVVVTGNISLFIPDTCDMSHMIFAIPDSTKSILHGNQAALRIIPVVCRRTVCRGITCRRAELCLIAVSLHALIRMDDLQKPASVVMFVFCFSPGICIQADACTA